MSGGDQNTGNLMLREKVYECVRVRVFGEGVPLDSLEGSTGPYRLITVLQRQRGLR